MEVRYPSPNSLFTTNSSGGAEIEGRATRKGGSSMKIASYTKNWEVSNVRWRNIQVPELPFPVKEVSYEIKLTTFTPWDKFNNNFKRLDTLGFWYLSYQEVLRHLAAAASFTQSPLWKTICEIRDAEFDAIKDAFLKYFDICLHADTSFTQYQKYVHAHASSASPFGGSYGDLENSPGLLKLAHERTVDWMRAYRDWFDKSVILGKQQLVQAKYTYPGVRARPADYIVRQINDYEVLAFASKWRDRKVGGIPGMSQFTFSIYENEHHQKAEEAILAYIKRLLHIEVMDLGVHGPEVYLDLINADKERLYIYDGKTQEKQTGLVFKDFGFAADLGHPHFEADAAPEMYSGMGITKPTNAVALSLMTRAEMDEHGFSPTKTWMFSDNIAFDQEMPPNVFVSKERAFCGLDPIAEVFGPPSLVTDNPSHRLQFKNGYQKQSQRVQYVMRPLMACVANNIGVPGTCRRFLQYVVDSKVFNREVTDETLQDNLKDAILSKDKAEHEKFQDKFADVLEYVNRWFIIQDREPEFVSDLRVT